MGQREVLREIKKEKKYNDLNENKNEKKNLYGIIQSSAYKEIYSNSCLH